MKTLALVLAGFGGQGGHLAFPGGDGVDARVQDDVRDHLLPDERRLALDRLGERPPLGREGEVRDGGDAARERRLRPGAVVVAGASPQVDVRIHPARHDPQPGGIDLARAGPRGQPGPDLDDGPVPHPHVRVEPPLRGNHGAPADEDLLAWPWRPAAGPGRAQRREEHGSHGGGMERAGGEVLRGGHEILRERRDGTAVHHSRAARRTASG